MVHLQKIYLDNKDKGLVILGFNAADDRAIAVKELERQGVTFPNILDSSREAVHLQIHDYKTSGVPLNYIIDKQGLIVDGFYGNDDNFSRAWKALRKAGLP